MLTDSTRTMEGREEGMGMGREGKGTGREVIYIALVDILLLLYHIYYIVHVCIGNRCIIINHCSIIIINFVILENGCG